MIAVVSRYRLKPKRSPRGPSGMSQPDQKQSKQQSKDELDDRFPSQAEGEEETVDKDLRQKEQQQGKK
jgi:hypothetical protein